MGDQRPGTALQTVVFHEPKVDAPESEWEDCGGYASADPRTGRPARLIVVDGATEAYDSIRWVGQLVESFLGAEGPSPREPAELDQWFGLMQQRWLDHAPAFATVFEERAFFDRGSFATLVACEVHGLGQPEPHWTGAALGDAVLFHVRAGHVLTQMPDLRADDFGLNPDGVFTLPSERQRMRENLRFAQNQLQVGDLLLLATDALAQYLTRQSEAGQECWSELVAVEHPRAFRQWVADRRRDGAMKDDDVTMLRAQITPADAEILVVCR